MPIAFVRTALALSLLASAEGLAFAQSPPAAQPAAAATDPVAALKQNLATGAKALRQYEWVETTVVSLKGEPKSRKQNRCYYGADGTLQKIPLESAPAAAAPAPGGRRGGRLKQQIIENKKDEYAEYMQRAAALVHGYVPPDPAAIQKVKDAGRLSMSPQPGGSMRLTLPQYQKAGDSLIVDLDPAASRLLGVSVASYLDSPEDAVSLAVKMTTLPDGAVYAAQTTLDAPAKKIQVVITNSGHRPLAR
ncbi:hypothetical protein [Luteitalea sp.]|jgi:hypothetical protein|uniref:hypothetical protein n=1 Tax=Luteitalea sp. TaxID=2004800 RepID=UPI0037C8C1F5